MNYVAFNSTLIYGGVLAAVILALVGIGLIATRRDKSESVNSIQSNLKMMGSLLLGIAVVAVSTTIATDSFHSAVRAEVKDTYGLELSDEEIAALEYPGAKPREDFAVFGSFAQNQRGEAGSGSLSQREIYLTWDDGEMHLAESTDGENFTPLAAAR